MPLSRPWLRDRPKGEGGSIPVMGAISGADGYLMYIGLSSFIT